MMKSQIIFSTQMMKANDATKTVAAASDSSIAVAVGAASQDYTE